MKLKKQKPAVKKNLVGRPKDAGKRQDIVRAAQALFLKNGYALTSMEAVAKKADVSKLTIYSHFSNKDELFKEVIQQRCGKLAAPESYMALEKEPVEKALLELGLSYTTMIFTMDSIRMHRVMQAESTRHPKVVQIFFEVGPKRVRNAFSNLLQAWQDKNKVSIPDIAKATEQFFSLLKGETLMRVMLLQEPMPNQNELKRHVRATVDFFLAVYQPKPKHK